MKFVLALISTATAFSLKLGEDCSRTPTMCSEGNCCGYATPVLGGLTERRCNINGSSSLTDTKTKT